MLEKPFVHSRGHIFSPILMFVLMKSRTSSNMDYVSSKTRSLGQMLEKLWVRSRGNIFSLIIMKLGQDVCLEEISGEFENGSCWVINSCNVNFLPCVRSRSHIFSAILMKIDQNVCFDKISDVFENGSSRVKN